MNEQNHLGAREYFVDEAGDGTLFSSRGRVIIGEPGCSRAFISGLLAVDDSARLETSFAELRTRLMADPYFRGVPSMQPDARKTAAAFHAKDDVPEVRREVLALLAATPCSFSAVVKSKHSVLEYVRSRNPADSSYRYHPNELYDYLVRRLFKQRLHKGEACPITFSKRGKGDRTQALHLAIETARLRFRRESGIASTPTITVRAKAPAASAGLQAVDYFLWALQRLFERREDRFTELLWPRTRLVIDIDDTREKPYGAYYTQRRPLRSAALPEAPEI